MADERDRALVLLLLDTGLRLSELVSLRVGDMRPDGTLHVLGKGAKERIVPLGTTARRALVRYLATRTPAALGGPSSRPRRMSVRTGRSNHQAARRIYGFGETRRR